MINQRPMNQIFIYRSLVITPKLFNIANQKERETKVPGSLKDLTASKNSQFSRHPIYAYVHARDVIQIK